MNMVEGLSAHMPSDINQLVQRFLFLDFFVHFLFIIYALLFQLCSVQGISILSMGEGIYFCYGYARKLQDWLGDAGFNIQEDIQMGKKYFSNGKMCYFCGK